MGKTYFAGAIKENYKSQNMIWPVPNQGIRKILVSHESEYWVLQNIFFAHWHKAMGSIWSQPDPCSQYHTADPSTKWGLHFVCAEETSLTELAASCFLQLLGKSHSSDLLHIPYPDPPLDLKRALQQELKFNSSNSQVESGRLSGICNFD